MKNLGFRQVHLDFHTSEHIDNIGAEFDPKEFAEVLKSANVDSITCFSKCHHGWSYHTTKVGKTHPNLKCELLPLQIEALLFSAGALASDSDEQYAGTDHEGNTAADTGGRQFPGWQ